MVEEARGGWTAPELVAKIVGDGGGAGEIGDSLGAPVQWFLRGKEGEREAIKRARSQASLIRQFTRIQAE